MNCSVQSNNKLDLNTFVMSHDIGVSSIKISELFVKIGGFEAIGSVHYTD
jgi:hypothetical protein